MWYKIQNHLVHLIPIKYCTKTQAQSSRPHDGISPTSPQNWRVSFLVLSTYHTEVECLARCCGYRTISAGIPGSSPVHIAWTGRSAISTVLLILNAFNSIFHFLFSISLCFYFSFIMHLPAQHNSANNKRVYAYRHLCTLEDLKTWSYGIVKTPRFCAAFDPVPVPFRVVKRCDPHPTSCHNKLH